MAVNREFNKKIKTAFTAVEKRFRKRTLIILMLIGKRLRT
jgi:hypothetical protein